MVRILFGGFSQLGWVLVAFGMVFVWIFDAGARIAEWVHFSGDVETVQGTTIHQRAPVLRMIFEFDVPGQGTFEVEAKTHRPERFQDEERESLVYHPRDPDAAVLLDELACEPRIGDRGELVVGRRGPPTAL